MAPIIWPSPTTHSLRAGQTTHKDRSKPRPEENRESRGSKKIKVKVKILYSKHYWAIKYKKKNLQMD
jgi:hypothetical protein